MSIFGGIGKALKGVGKVVGKVGGIAAPILAATGVGLPLAAGIGAGSALLRGGGLKGAALGAGGALAGGLAGKALGTSQLLKGGPAQGILGKAIQGLRGTAPQALTMGAARPGLTPAQSAQMGAAGFNPAQIARMTGQDTAGNGGYSTAQATGAPGLLSRIGSAIGKHPLQAAQVGLAGANLVAGAKAQGRAGQLQNRALGRLEQPTPVDLSSVFAGSGNPYDQPLGPNRARLAAAQALQ